MSQGPFRQVSPIKSEKGGNKKYTHIHLQIHTHYKYTHIQIHTHILAHKHTQAPVKKIHNKKHTHILTKI